MNGLKKGVLLAATAGFVVVIAGTLTSSGKGSAGIPPAATAAPSPGPTPTLAPGERIITEEQLNQQMSQALLQRTGGVPFRDMHVALLGDGKVALSGVTALAGNDVPVQVSLAVELSRGLLNIDIVGAQAGGLPLPAGLADALATQAAQAAGLPGLKGITLPPEVQSVTIRQGAVVIGLRPR